MGGMLYIDIDLLGRGMSELRLGYIRGAIESSRHVRRAIANEISTQTIGRFLFQGKKHALFVPHMYPHSSPRPRRVKLH